MEKGRILQKSIAVILVLCMTAVNFILAITNTVYAITQADGKITFDAYFKIDGQSTAQGKANVSEGGTLYISLKLDSGELQNGKVKIENANFKIADNIESEYVSNVNSRENEIELNKIDYNDGEIEIALPVEFEEAEKINIAYLEMENSISLSGTYRNGEDGTEITTDAVNTKLTWTQGLGDEENKLKWGYKGAIEKAVVLDNKTIIETSITMDYTQNYFPKETEKVTISIPKINNVTPSYKILVNGDKISNENVTSTNMTVEEQTVNAITFTNEFVDGDYIKWTNKGDTYKIIYVYNGVTNISEGISLDAQVETKIYDKEAKSKELTNIHTNGEKGTIASVEAVGTSEDIYKGYMYANSNETIFEEEYNLEISDVEDTTATLELAQSNFEDQNEEKVTVNDAVYYKELKINKNSLENVIGTNGKLNITLYNLQNNEKNIELKINQAEEDEEGNIVVDYENIAEPVKAKIEVIDAQNEGTIKIIAKKAIKGNTGHNRESLETIKTIETTVSASTNKQDAKTTSTAKTELKETKNSATLTMNNNNILSTSQVNNIEFVATLKAGTMELDLLKNPTLEITLPEEVTYTRINSARVLNAEGVLEETPETEIVDARKIIVRISGEQLEFNNQITQGVNVLISAEIKLNETAISREGATIDMVYTNQNVAKPYTTSIENVSILSNYGIVTSTALQTVFESENKGTQTLAAIFVNNYGDDVENLSLIGTIPGLDLTQEEFEKTIKDTFIIGSSNENASNKVDQLVIQYSQDKETWSTDKQNAVFYKISITGDNYKESLENGERVIVKYAIDTNMTLPAYWYEYEVNGITYTQTLKIDRQNEVEPEEQEDGTDQGSTNDETSPLVVKVVAKTGNSEVKDGDEVQQGQVIRYTYTIKNNTENDITNVKLVANHENANVFEDETFEEIDTSNSTEMIQYTFETEKEKSDLQYNVGTIKAGKTKTLTYQIRVKEDAEELKMNTSITADDIEEIKFEASNNVKKADLRLELKNNVSKEYSLVGGDIFANTLIVENISEQTLENIMVTFAIPKGFKNFDFRAEENNGNYTIIEKNNDYVVFSINQLAAKATKRMVLSLKVDEDEFESKSVALRYWATINSNVYYSNEVEINVNEKITSTIKATQTANIKKDVVKTGDKLIYNITVKNNGDNLDFITISDDVPKAAVVKNAYYVMKDKQTKIDGITNNSVVAWIYLDAGEEVNLYIETEIDESVTSEEEITNIANVTGMYITDEVTTNEVTYKLEANIPKQEEKENDTQKETDTDNKDNEESDNNNDGSGEKQEEEQDNKDNETQEDEKSNSTVVMKHNISGLAWIDENKNGIREESEKLLSGIKVNLANIETGKFITDSDGNRIEITTDDKGEYKFEKIKDGKYIVIFTYDNTKYRNTEYKAKNASEQNNSDIITSKLSKTNEDIKYAITDTLELNGKNLSNIDAGFIENELFDLNINKYITKITLQNSSDTVVKQYSKEKLAKVEIDSKNLAGTKVLIEYTMQITNDGEVAGYVNEIVDYLPKDVTFESSMNKQWYLSTDGYLHTNALSKEIINPGETKEVTLTLVKTMTDNNVGLTSNEAEIVNYSNDLSIPDKDKINTSSAEMIISIRTGVGFTVGIIITLIGITTAGVIVYTKKRKEAIHE